MKTTAGNHGEVAKGRGSPINPEGRFEKWQRDAADDGWFQDPPEDRAKLKTVVTIEHAKTIITRNNSPDIGFDRSINPYQGCAHGCSFCISGDTPILMGNGRTLPLSEVRMGDEIYGTKRIGLYRRYTKTRVLAHWSSIKPAFRITLEDGTKLTASGDHRFLTEGKGWKHVTKNAPGQGHRPYLTKSNELLGTGAFAEGPGENDDYRRGYLCGMIRGDGHLKIHDYPSQGRVGVFRLALCDDEALLRAQDYLVDFGIATQEFRVRASGNCREANGITNNSMRKYRGIVALVAWPTNPTSDWSKGFLAGIFDAEGNFTKSWRLCNTDPEIIAWVTRCLTVLGFAFVIEQQDRAGRKPIEIVRLKGGLREHLRFFHTVRPAITRKLNLDGQMVKSDAKLRVVSVEPLGKAMRLYDITTETEDFIANGVVSHNCYARPSHAYYGLSPGIDFETRLFAKTSAAEKLREELAQPRYTVEPIAIGVNTDAYQPIEREYKVTRSILEVLEEVKHPAYLITKSALIERDIDLLASMSRQNLIAVTITIVTLDQDISRHLEPRTTAPARRLKAIEKLAAAGIPVSVNVAPVIPFLTDSELESILEAAKNAGASSAAYTLLRLPWEVKDIFRAWLDAHYPLKAAHVMSRVHQMRGGRDNDPEFGSRMKGQGAFAELLAQRFRKAIQRFGLEKPTYELDCNLFVPPSLSGQARLF